MNANPGDLVVCVDDSPCTCCGASAPVRLGAIYCVEGFEKAHGVVGYVLVGVPKLDGAMHFGFRGINVERFRKIRPDEQSGIRADWELILETNKRKVSALAEQSVVGRHH